MTPIERTEAIKDLAALELPALLLAAGLDDFAEYLNKSPLRSDDKEFCVYIDSDDNNTSQKSFSVIIQCQLYGDDQVQEYHSVIMPWIEEKLVSAVVDYEYRDSIKADIWPMDLNQSAFIYYSILYVSELEDCDN